MEKNTAATSASVTDFGLSKIRPLPRSFTQFVGQRIIRLIYTLHGLGAFALITFGAAISKFNTATKVVHPLIRAQIQRAGVKQLPVLLFIALALGFVVIGQTVALMSRVGVEDMAGKVMVTVVVRELGPLVTALLVLARVGTVTVIELGTARALGEVEAMEALGIDPIHYLVVPRVIGLALSIFALNVYLILCALGAGYLFLFLQDVPLAPGDYVQQIAAALRWEDFALLFFKTTAFGAIIAIVTCYVGLAQPMKLGDVAQAATRAVVYSVNLCVLLDLILILYLVL